MINLLGGNEKTVEAHNKAVGKKIKNAEINEKSFRLTFEDDSTLTFSDEGQSCCEYRHMNTDDDPKSLIGQIFRTGELADAPSMPCEYDVHEVQFLRIHTDQDILTISNHNEHNGYYGGFAIVCR